MYKNKEAQNSVEFVRQSVLPIFSHRIKFNTPNLPELESIGSKYPCDEVLQKCLESIDMKYRRLYRKGVVLS